MLFSWRKVFELLLAFIDNPHYIRHMHVKQLTPCYLSHICFTYKKVNRLELVYYIILLEVLWGYRTGTIYTFKDEICWSQKQGKP